MAKKKVTKKTDQPYNPMLDLRERERTHQLANYYHRRDAVQFTSVTMETISFQDAQLFTEQILDMDVDMSERLVRLIAGIAAIEDHEYRQRCALHAIQAVFLRSEDGEKCMANFVDGVNAWLGEDKMAQ